jgi:hypothetical protein
MEGYQVVLTRGRVDVTVVGSLTAGVEADRRRFGTLQTAFMVVYEKGALAKEPPFLTG